MSFRNILLVAAIVFSSCKQSAHLVKTETTTYPLNKPGYTEVDSSILNSYSTYKHTIDSIMDRVIIVSEMSMQKKTPEGLLGNFTADAALKQVENNFHSKDFSKIDFCFLNNGGLRAALPKGDITIGNIYSLMPFENEMVLLTLNGATTLKLINFIAAKGGMHVSGLTMHIQDSKVTEAKIQGMPFDSTKSYVVATSDYLANGGDNLSFLVDAEKKIVTGLKLRDLLIQYLEEKNKKGEKLSAKIEGRIIYDK